MAFAQFLLVSLVDILPRGRMHIGLANAGRVVNFAIGVTIEVAEWVIVAFSVACSSIRRWKASQHSDTVVL